ncbi:MAG: UDP-glucose 4-epimerase GalE, partial [Planctomycetota bacterium]
MAKVIVTGGAGYVGSHTCVELLQRGDDVVVIDNLCNAPREALQRVEEVSGRELVFEELDLRDRGALLEVVAKKHRDAEAVIHLAAFKAVGESVAHPLRYYENNLVGVLNLAEAVCAAGIGCLVFSSSAAVYGAAEVTPVSETARLEPANPYGHTKAMAEQIFADLAAAHGLGLVSLRYFNPAGAHESGRMGEDPLQPSNLLPVVCDVASGRTQELVVFGDDWPTCDGTGVRDYLHIVDLAKAHLAALDKILETRDQRVYNLGTGRGYSVLEVVRAFEEVSGRNVPYRIGPRRSGDVAIMLADPALAWRELGWKATLGLERMVADGWRWRCLNPHGF